MAESAHWLSRVYGSWFGEIGPVEAKPSKGFSRTPPSSNALASRSTGPRQTGAESWFGLRFACYDLLPPVCARNLHANLYA